MKRKLCVLATLWQKVKYLQMKNYISINALYDLFISCNQQIITDTRKLEKGAIFFALKGDNFDANSFAKNAISAGCNYAIVDDEKVADGVKILLVENVLSILQQLAKYHRSQLNIPVIGITGSNGKTTNKELINAVLSKKYNSYATKGNLNNHIGVPLTLLSITAKHEMAIIEMGANHRGEISMLCDLANPNYGIITNIGKAHLEGFGGEEGIKKGKSELYQHLKNNNGKVFVNGNDPMLMQLSGDLDKVLYGENKSYDVFGEMFNNSEYVEFRWATKNKEIKDRPLIKTNMFGHYNFINLLCAVCIGNYFGVEETLINQAVVEYLPEMNRSQVKKTTANTLILDAYNANPSSMALAIENFINQPLKNKMYVLGDMLELGEYSDQEHEKIIDQLAKNKVRNSVFVGDIFYKFKNDYQEYHFFKNIDDLIEYFKNQRLEGYTLLIKGSRGVKLEKIVDFL